MNAKLNRVRVYGTEKEMVVYRQQVESEKAFCTALYLQHETRWRKSEREREESGQKLKDARNE